MEKVTKQKGGLITCIKRRKMLFIVVALVVSAGAYSAINTMKPIEVKTEIAQKSTFYKTIEDVAFVSDAGQHEMYSQSGGEVSRVYVKAGAEVQAGQTILELKNIQSASETSQKEIQISQTEVQISQIDGQMTAQNAVITAAKTALDAAEKEKDRAENLFKEGGISQAVLDAARQAHLLALDAYNGARSTLASLQDQKNAVRSMRNVQSSTGKEHSIISPKTGVLLAMPWEQGQIVSPGELLLTVGEGNKTTIKADYLADDTVSMTVGQKVLITSPVLPQEGIEGKVTQIAPMAAEKISALGIAQRRVSVTIDAPAIKGIKPGFEVRAAVITEEMNDVIVLSQAFIHQSEGRQMVWTVADGLLHETEIMILSQNSKEAAVSGISEGDIIVTSPPENAKESMKVKVQ